MSNAIQLNAPMKPTPNSLTDRPLLAFGAHPDDIEFGCGGIIAGETRAGRSVHLVVCSRGEAGTNGTPEQRTRECERAAAILGATLEFVELDGDAHLEIRTAHILTLASVIRRVRPAILLAPTLFGNQHPDHSRLGQLVRDAARLARYAGVAELKEWPSHKIASIFFYSLALETEPKDIPPLLVDVSTPEVLTAWTAAMEAHQSQTTARAYVETQLGRARLRGLSAGVSHAIALFPSDPIVVDSLEPVRRGAREF